MTRILIPLLTKLKEKKKWVSKKTKERAARVEEEEVTFNSDNFPHSDKTKPTLLLFLSFFLWRSLSLSLSLTLIIAHFKTTPYSPPHFHLSLYICFLFQPSLQIHSYGSSYLRPRCLRATHSRRSFLRQGAPAVGPRPHLPDTLAGGGAFLAGDAILLQQRRLLAVDVLLHRRGASQGHGLRRRLAAGVVETWRRTLRRGLGEGAYGGELGVRRGRRGSASGFGFDLFVQVPKQKQKAEVKRSVLRWEWESRWKWRGQEQVAIGGTQPLSEYCVFLLSFWFWLWFFLVSH